MVTHEPGMQPLLPQVLVGNEKVFTQALMKSMKPKLPRNFVMLRKKSAWNCHATMREILSLLAKALKKVMEGRSVILILDVHSSHFDIFDFCTRAQARSTSRLCSSFVDVLVTAMRHACVCCSQTGPPEGMAEASVAELDKAVEGGVA
jgi:hypothetical protein